MILLCLFNAPHGSFFFFFFAYGTIAWLCTQMSHYESTYRHKSSCQSCCMQPMSRWLATLWGVLCIFFYSILIVFMRTCLFLLEGAYCCVTRCPAQRRSACPCPFIPFFFHDKMSRKDLGTDSLCHAEAKRNTCPSPRPLSALPNTAPVNVSLRCQLLNAGPKFSQSPAGRKQTLKSWGSPGLLGVKVKKKMEEQWAALMFVTSPIASRCVRPLESNVTQHGLLCDSSQQKSFSTKTNISFSFLMTQAESAPKDVALLNHFRGILLSLWHCQVTPGSHSVRGGKKFCSSCVIQVF